MSTPGSLNELLIGAAGAAGGGYQISRSLRFNSSDSAYLSRTPSTAGNRKTFTLSLWIKRGTLDSLSPLLADIFFGAYTDDNNRTSLSSYAYNVDLFGFNHRIGGVTVALVYTLSVQRDFSAWYHFVASVDSTAAVAADRVKLYINGVNVTDTSGSTYPAQNTDFLINNTQQHTIGRNHSTLYANGYLADIHFIDGQALDPTSFTETDATTGQLIPKAYSGTYGTNGFHLPFSDNSTAAALGTDTSGNSNTWTVNNISVLGALASPNWAANLTSSTGSFAAGYPAANAFDGSTGTGAATSTGGGLSVNLTWTNTRFNTGNPTLRVYTYQAYKIDVDGVTKNADGAGPNTLAWVDCGTITGGFSTVVVYGYSGTNSGSYIAAIEVNGQILVGPSVAAGNDSLVDTPTSYGTDTGAGGEVRGNYCTFNPLEKGSSATLSNGNLDASFSAASLTSSTFGLSSGKWYWEVTVTTTNPMIGIVKQGCNLASYPGSDPLGWGYSTADGFKYTGGSGSSYGAAATTNDVIGVAFDADNGTLIYYKNGSSQGTAFTGLTSGPYLPAVGRANGTPSVSANFGQRPFAYTAPSGFQALCTTNLPAPVVAQPSTVMDVALYTGTGSSLTVSSLGFSPDLVWLKSRGAARNHRLTDTVRGATIALQSDLTSAEVTEANGLTAFNSNGFTVGSSYSISSEAWVGWCWDAGSSTVTNTQGSITSSVRANASAGFSVVSFVSGSTSSYTVGHGLGVTPEFMIFKDRDTSGQPWCIYHKSLGSSQYLLFSTAAAASASWGGSPTSSVFYGSTTFFVSSKNIIGYCFAPVAGYSSFGSYTGNGSADGPFVYCGFRPRWVLFKASSTTGDWRLMDTSRDLYNPEDSQLYPNNADAEITSALHQVDYLSNGFKVVTGSSAMNASGVTYIYAAFAESPFQYARAR